MSIAMIANPNTPEYVASELISKRWIALENYEWARLNSSHFERRRTAFEAEHFT